ncbi:MAG: hypothetical protein M3R34_00080, partial [Acidobacteriota bacterium]|nr:hypothetical protein [Acidobacteriota bacterium]
MRLLALVLLLALPAPAAAPRPGKVPAVAREVAVTFDDLPGVSVARSDPGGSPDSSLAAMTARLIATLKAER